MIWIVISAVVIAILLFAGLVVLIVWTCKNAKEDGANIRVAKHDSAWWKSFIASYYIITDRMLNKHNKKK